MGCCISSDSESDSVTNRLGRDINTTPEIGPIPTTKEWYHGNITNNEAEERLKFAAKEDGNYLVYDFYNEAGPVHGEYMLLIYFDGGKVYQQKISRRRDGRFILGEDKLAKVESYASVRELIKAHRGMTGKPLARLADGRLVKLSIGRIRPKVLNQPRRRSIDTSEQERPASNEVKRRVISTRCVIN